jgi:foldase protein PrsA
MRGARVLLPIVLAAGVLAGCGGGGTASLQSNDVAVVGRSHVTLASYNELMEQAKLSLGKSYPKQGTSNFEALKGRAVVVLVEEAEREQAAQKDGIKITSKQISNLLASIKKNSFGGSEAKFQAAMKQQHLNASQVNELMRQQLVYNALVARITKGLSVTDAQVHQYYTAHASSYSQPESRDVRYILVKSKKAADSVYTQVKAGGKPAWCRLAKKYAKDASGQNCGKGTFSKGQTVKAFDSVLFSTPTNVVHKPVYDSTEYKSWFVIQPISRVRPSTKTPESKVASSIRTSLLTTKKNQAITKWFNSLTKSYCGGNKIKYQVGYAPSPDPCQSTTSTNTTT